MKGATATLPEACARAQAAIERDPLELPGEAAAHVRGCPACFEVQVAWLAQEEADALAPAGYFEQLPERVLSKLPAAPRRRRLHPALWALAATLLAAMGVGGYLVGRANRTPMVEATLSLPPAESPQPLPDMPFTEGEDDYVQLTNLSPEEANRFIERVGGAGTPQTAH